MSEFKCPECGAALTVTAKTEQAKKAVSVEDVRILFPKDLEELLTFEGKEDRVIIRPRQYLGSQNFAKIAAIVREAGGEYISAGKESHFRIATNKE